MQWISSSPLNFGIGVRSQLAAILLFCIRFYLFFLHEIGAIAGDADSSRAPGLTSGLQGSVNVHRGALLLVPQ